MMMMMMEMVREKKEKMMEAEYSYETTQRTALFVTNGDRSIDKERNEERNERKKKNAAVGFVASSPSEGNNDRGACHVRRRAQVMRRKERKK